MIPADLLARLKPATALTVEPATPTQSINDKLTDLLPGQRVMAEIQALLPNGAYRAMIAQREVILSLPFAAKNGDALELEVVSHNGRLAFAATSTPGEAGDGEAATTSLSNTGQFIAKLLGNQDGGREVGQRISPTLLNGGQPLLEEAPTTGKATGQLAQALQQATSSSGLFYESHQAKWVAGEVSLQSLLQEPQGKLSRPETLAAPVPSPLTPATEDTPTPATLPQAVGQDTARATTTDNRTPASPPPPLPGGQDAALADAAKTAGKADTQPVIVARHESLTPSAQPVAPELTPLVQQQLSTLSDQSLAWQGMAWPGQNIQLQINDEGEPQREKGGGKEERTWTSRLRVNMEHLGNLDAAISLRGHGVSLSIESDGEATRRNLLDALPELKERLEAVGISLEGFTVRQHVQAE